MYDVTNTVGLHYRFTKTVQWCWGTICCWGTSLSDGALTFGAEARAPAAATSLVYSNKAPSCFSQKFNICLSDMGGDFREDWGVVPPKL